MKTRDRAAAKAKLHLRYAAMAEPLFGVEKSEPFFAVDGLPCPLSEFVEHNADDPDVVAWAKTAKVGESYPAFVPCERVS
jgi:hypothetical protein